MASATEGFTASIEQAERLDSPAYAMADVLSTTLELTAATGAPVLPTRR